MFVWACWPFWMQSGCFPEKRQERSHSLMEILHHCFAKQIPASSIDSNFNVKRGGGHFAGMSMVAEGGRGQKSVDVLNGWSLI